MTTPGAEAGAGRLRPLPPARRHAARWLREGGPARRRSAAPRNRPAACAPACGRHVISRPLLALVRYGPSQGMYNLEFLQRDAAVSRRWLGLRRRCTRLPRHRLVLAALDGVEDGCAS